MHAIKDIQSCHILRAAKRSADAENTAVCDTLGADFIGIRFIVGNVAGTAAFQAKHASASGTLFASATAYGTAIRSSTTTSGNQFIWIVPTAPYKRFVRIKFSAVAGSSDVAVIVDKYHNDAVPPATGAYNVGFASVTVID